MKINSISQSNIKFNGWAQFARDRIQVCISSGNCKSGFGVQKLIESIERNSPYHTVSLDISYDFPLFRAVHLPKHPMAKDFEVKPEFFSKSVAGCLRRLNGKLEKESSRIDKILDKQDKIKKAATIFEPQNQVKRGAMPEVATLKKEPHQITPEELMNMPISIKKPPVAKFLRGVQVGNKTSEFPPVTKVMEGPPPKFDPLRMKVTPIVKEIK